MKTQTIPHSPGAKKALSTKKSPTRRTIKNTTANTHDENHVTMKSLLKEEVIASRAYKIWQEQGCPEGFDEMHWRLAEQEILETSSKDCAA